jgi:hypothetical protein
MARNRNEFSKITILQIAKRAGWLCAFPSCRKHTVGATEDGKGEINIGTAAHICAAAPGGPRYDENMSETDRSSAENGIWMCRDHGKVIDSDVKHFTVSLLHQWKKESETESWRRVLQGKTADSSIVVSDTNIAVRLRTAAEQDLEVFRRTAKWPSTSVALRLATDALDEPVAADALARAVTAVDDLILVAGPGMGKTTTVFQIAEEILKIQNGIPLVVMLNEWAIEDASMLASILSRPAFHGISEDEFRKAAAQRGIVLLLDGWNELDDESRKRARIQVGKLKAELTELGLVVSTRKPRNEALNIPFRGRRVDILSLSDEQQMEIANALRSDEGAKLVDQAWRTPGVRDLVTIPLYLTALLSLPRGAPFPETKEQVLQHFVAAHENEANRAEALYAVVQDFQQAYLNGLAVVATQTGHNSLPDIEARRSVSDTATRLADDRQIEIKPDPNAVLDVLVGNHVLMRAGNQPGVSFQHHQFQEWYASHYVEHFIVAHIDDPVGHENIKREIFDWVVWEEAILFAVERMSRGNQNLPSACAKAIMAAFEVDPILAAEMIYRSTDAVWSMVSKPIQALVARWHKPGKVDRAFRFMLMSGRPEFLDYVWPLITDANNQVSLKALRSCKRFRPSILGKDAAKNIAALPIESRKVLLHEIASHGGFDGLDLATQVAKGDSKSEVKASVIDALAFRRADRHVVEILQSANDETFDLVSSKELVNEVPDKDIQKRIAAARKRRTKEGTSLADQLRAIVYAPDDQDDSAELTKIIATMELDRKNDTGSHYIYEARNRYPQAVADGILERVRAGRELFYKADKALALARFSFEDEELLNIAMNNSNDRDDRANAAAAVLGPKSAGRMIDAFIELIPRIREDSAASERFRVLTGRITSISADSLIPAIAERSPGLNNAQMAQLANLLSRCPDRDSDYDAPFDDKALTAIHGFIQDWGRRMLASPDAGRWQKAQIATLASHFPSTDLLSLLKDMHEDNLRRLGEFRAQAEASGWQRGDAVDEARHPHTREYFRAFLAIKTPETIALMRTYLEHKDFGVLAARVLADFWRANNEPPKDKRFFGDVDWSDVKVKRAARATDPNFTCDEAEAIFEVIDRLITEEDAPEQQRLGVALAIVALRLPHGQRNDVIRRLISIAPRKAYESSGYDLLLSLVLSGDKIDIADVNAGIDQTLELAKSDWSILNQNDGWQLKVWLRLIPFSSDPIQAIPILLNLVKTHRRHFFQEMIRVCAFAPSDKVEEFLFALAEADARFYDQHEWRDSVVKLDTASSARRLINLVADGSLSKRSSADDWHFTQQLATLVSQHPDLRQHIYELLKDGASTPGLWMLARTIAEIPDEEGLMVLMQCERNGRSFRGWRTLEKVVTEHIPVEGYQGAYNVSPIPVTELRRRLISMTTDGGATDIAAGWMNDIDEIRDEYGLPEGEPRHPDLASGKPWPIMPPVTSEGEAHESSDAKRKNA